MESKVLSVFFGEDLLPYKDSERTVHYPVGGNAFAGSNNTNQIRFYVDQIGGTSGISWVVVSKLPNGKLGYEPISNVASDSDLGEDYLIFDLSSYYTQYKGVVKLALRGYQGNITFTDSGYGTYEVSGEPLIGVTGTIDLAINYSPFVNTGAELLPTDIDRILASLSGYTPLSNAIVVVSSLPNDLSAYNEGQLFYNKQDDLYYIYQGGSLSVYLGQFYSKITVVDDISNETENNYGEGAIVYSKSDRKYYIMEENDFVEYYRGIILTSDVNSLTINDYDLDTVFFEYKETGGYYYGRLYGIVVEQGERYWEELRFQQLDTQDINVYGSARVTGELRITNNARMVYSDNKWILYVNGHSLAFSTSGILTIDGYTVGTQDWVNDNFYTQLQVDGLLDNYVDKGSTQTISGQKTFSGRAIFSGYANLYNSYLDTNNKNYFARVGITTGQYVTYKLPYNYSDVGATTYTLATIEDVNGAISTLKANSFIVVDYTDTHPTLNDFLASIGEEGYIYLYPIDTSDLTKGYYQYIWESNAWLDIGTTQIDLSGYVQKTTTIAGVDLQDNITSSELLTALGLEFTDVEIDED